MHLFVGDPAGVKNVFVACEDQKQYELFEMHICVGPGPRMLFKHKTWKLDTTSLLLP